MKKLVSLVLALFAASASAQVNNRGVIVKDEGSQLGLARTVDFVGSSVSCGISGGQATCTFTAGGITVGSAISSGTNGRLLYQDASGNLAQISALAFDGSILTLGGVAGSGDNVVFTNGTSTRNIVTFKDNTTTRAYMADGGDFYLSGTGKLYGDNTTPHLSLTSGGGAFFGYGANEVVCAGSYCGPYNAGFNARFPTVTTAIAAGGTISTGLQQEYRSVIHSYTWANAQVTGLGAVTSGEWIAFTLPAKTKLENLYVIITGAAAGPATVTVSCGRTGAAYIDYIVASDAKAAANTIYGNDAAERGTNLTGYDLPSYTATTAVRCQFVSTGANLSTVTGSAGTIVVETVLIP